MLNDLSADRGVGTTFVTLLVPGGQDMSLTTQKVTQELATAERIKSRATRQAVSSALRSVKARLAAYGHLRAPATGVAVFASDVRCELVDDLPERIASPLYRCDSRFHVDPLLEMLDGGGPDYAVVVFDGSGLTVASVSGRQVRKLGELTARLPKKHGRGGQSAPRFQHTRLSERTVFRKRAQDTICHLLIGPDHLPVVKGVVVAGCSTFKNELELDARLARLVMATVSVQYGGMSGVYEALDKARPVLHDCVLFEEADVVRGFFERLATDRPACFGADHTARALAQGAVELLLLSDETLRLCTMADGSLRLAEPGDDACQEAESCVPLIEADVPFRVVSAATREGAQFAAGFRVAALLSFVPYGADETSHDDSDSDDSFA